MKTERLRKKNRNVKTYFWFDLEVPVHRGYKKPKVRYGKEELDSSFEFYLPCITIFRFEPNNDLLNFDVVENWVDDLLEPDGGLRK